MKIIISLLIFIGTLFAQSPLEKVLQECQDAFVISRIKLDSVRASNHALNGALIESKASEKALLRIITNDSLTIQRQDIIIANKEQQLKELEGVKIPVYNSSNPDWWKFGIGGAVLGALIYFIAENYIIKK